jgi:nucleotide-binding universal stress UspA family protein
LVLRDWQGERFRKILVCVDYSPMSAKALERAAELAISYGAHLEVIHVMFPPAEDYWGKVQNDEDCTNAEYLRAARVAAEAEMKEFLSACPVAIRDIDHHVEIVESRFPSVAITQKASAGEFDLVVLGTHGMSGFVSNFIGSNAENLINDCAVSVLAVRD